MDINFPRLRQELLTATRGELSQGQLNKKLKCRSNQIYRWESGQTAITWRDFCTLSDACRRPIAEAVRIYLAHYKPAADAAGLVRRLGGGRSQAELAAVTGVSRSVVSRWLKGSSPPTLEQMLRLIHGSGYSLTDFLTHLVSADALPSMSHEFKLDQAERDLHFKYPWVGAVILCLRTPAYVKLPKHEEGFIAAHLGLTLEQEQVALAELRAAGAVRARHGKFVPRRTSIALIGNREGNLRLRLYWLERCRELLVTPKSDPQPRPLIWPYLVFNTSQEKYQKITSKILALYDEIVRMTDGEDVEADEVYLFSLQLFDVRRLPSGKSGLTSNDNS